MGGCTERGGGEEGGGWALWRRSQLSLAEVFAAWKLLCRSRSQTHVAPLSDWMLRRRREGGGGEAEEEEEEENRVRAAEGSGQAAAERHSASFHRLSAATEELPS